MSCLRRWAVMLAMTGALAIVPVWVRAQTPEPSPATRLAPAYRIAVDDRLVITAPDIQSFGTQVAIVLSDGTITVAQAGQIKAVGLTPVELEKQINTALSKKYIKPRVYVTVSESNKPRRVSVIGAVKIPGPRNIREGWRVMNALTDAGGLPSDRSEFFRAELIRLSTGESFRIDVPKLLAGDASQNLVLEPDDVLRIDPLDEGQTFVQVVGEVVQPGAVVTPRDGSIVAVLNAARGVKPTAALSQAKIERKGAVIPIDLRSYVKDGSVPGNQRLDPGDKLIIPENKAVFRIYGNVAQQGELIYPDDRKITVREAIAYARGAGPGAELKKTRLTRVEASGQTVSQTINIEKMLKTGDFSSDVTVEPGDTIYVPPTPKRGLTALEAFSIGQTLILSLSYLRRL
jgi:polysaccharide export outer membrane protein